MEFGKKPEENGKKVKVQSAEMRENPLYQQQESTAKEVLSAIAVALVAVVLFCIIVANFSGYSARRSPSYGSRYTYADTDYNETPDPDENAAQAVLESSGASSPSSAESEEAASSETVDWSLVDVDAVNNTSVELSGLVVKDSSGLSLQLDEPLNFYIWDPSQSKDALVQGVERALLAVNSSVSMDAYTGQTVTADGTVEYRNGTILFQITSIVSSQDDPSIHRYQLVVEDCTWQDAFQKALSQGGYLARINSQEEYQTIVDLLNDGDNTKIHFYLGGRRDSNGTDYYWVDDQNQFLGSPLNSTDAWCSSDWYEGEPSFQDTGADAAEPVDETVLNLFCVSGSWYLNDASDDLSGSYNGLLNGKIGYIIEFED